MLVSQLTNSQAQSSSSSIEAANAPYASRTSSLLLVDDVDALAHFSRPGRFYFESTKKIEKIIKAYKNFKIHKKKVRRPPLRPRSGPEPILLCYLGVGTQVMKQLRIQIFLSLISLVDLVFCVEFSITLAGACSPLGPLWIKPIEDTSPCRKWGCASNGFFQTMVLEGRFILAISTLKSRGLKIHSHVGSGSVLRTSGLYIRCRVRFSLFMWPCR